MKPISWTMSNELRVVVNEIPTTPLAAVVLFAGGGARAERESEDGVAHFLEHLLFRGGAKYQLVNKKIEHDGGWSNAFTGQEFIGCFVHVFRERVEEMFDLLADMWYHARLDPQDIEAERGAVLQELAHSLDDTDEVAFNAYRKLLWGGHPLGHSVIGTKETIERFGRDDFVAYHRRIFHPANTVLSVAGGVLAKDIFELAFRYFGEIAPVSGTLPEFCPLDMKDSPPIVFVEQNTEQVRCYMGCVPERSLSYDGSTSKERVAFSLLTSILGGGASSRLFSNIRTDRGLVYSVSSEPDVYQDLGSYLIHFGADMSKTAQALGLILEELEKIAREGVTAEELRKAKCARRRSLAEIAESSLQVATEFGEIISRRVDFVDAEDYFRRFVDSITAGDIVELAKRYFRKENLRYCVVGPAGSYTKDIEALLQ